MRCSRASRSCPRGWSPTAERTLREFDLDAALARRPALTLVDELAHTNAPGSRHAKRWQDVLELLDGGISVYTTMNVQHVESLNDIVATITGVIVRETVPDSVLERADQIELVDLPPDELLAAPAGRQGLPSRAGTGGHPEFLPQGKPDGPPRARPPAHRRARGRGDAGLHARPRRPANLAGERAHPGLRQPEPALRPARARRPAPRRREWGPSGSSPTSRPPRASACPRTRATVSSRRSASPSSSAPRPSRYPAPR